ncbi:MAG: hypothetical protein H0T89_28450 [Deltaproteobacteria bacterium]|nr:hypothetical protein [Deltaproteobacteria bacterium]MDQ3300183.1 hypothetical protein [Myxococcota bacterium]
MSRAIGVMLLVVAASVLGACNPYLTAQSAAPPGRVARLDPVDGFWSIKSYKVELSVGVALAVTCAEGGPCHDLTVVSDDPAIATVRPASLGTLQPSGIASQATASAVVIVGKAPGTTRLRLRSREGTRDIRVTIVAPPAVRPVLIGAKDPA